MIKFPYGISDFHLLVTGGYFYVDRSGHIPLLEAAGNNLLFLRPRRFGKSLVLSMLENYYDLAKAAQFEQTFGSLAIGSNPTPLHNRYFVLTWDFSAVYASGDAAELRQALSDHINGTIEQFVVRYRHLLDYKIELDKSNAMRSFQAVLAAVQSTPYKLYLLIDEYDNFANEVLMSTVRGNLERYEELVKGEGVLKSVFKVIKSVSRGQGLERVFITGVSPVVMSDMSSGYNVAKNIYLEQEFSDLCGFSEAEVLATLNQIGDHCNFSADKRSEIFAMMRTYYNGYRFNIHNDHRLYNSTLALYFWEALQKTCTYPDEMLDDNLAMDRSRIAYIAQLGGAEELVLAALDETQPLITAKLAQRFGVADVMRPGKKGTEFLAALLYYFGVLTLQPGRTELQEYMLTIPNLVIREMYVERLRELLLPDVDDREDGQDAVRTFFRSGDIQPLCTFVEQRLFAVLDNRDYLAANELTVKTAFLSLLYNDKVYLVDSETAIQRGYADLTLILRPDLRPRQTLRDLILEFKYVKLSEVGLDGASVRQRSEIDLRALPAVQEQFAAARAQLQRYQRALQLHYADALRLHTYAVVAIGFDRIVWEEVPIL